MSNEALHARLAALRAELAAAPGLDPTTRRGVEQLADDAEALLAASPSGARHVTPSLRERLDDRVRELEVAHPKLSTTLGGIIDTLAFYGL